MVRLANEGSCSSILDLATGSGDVVFAFEHGVKSSPEIIGLDFF